jgi:phenylpyruvate tautomerase PptA (4-oxalocrotonate tautomerase family)
MPMIDITAPEGIFPESAEAALLQRAAEALIKWEHVTGIQIATSNTGAYLNILPKRRVTAGGQADDVVRVQLLTPVGALQQEQRQGITADITEIVVELSGRPELRDRTWVLFHQAVDGGWGIGGVAYTNAGLGDWIRASLKR